MKEMDERYVAVVDLGSSAVRLCVLLRPHRSGGGDDPAGEGRRVSRQLHLVWNTVGETALKVYNFMNKEEDAYERS